MKGDCTQIDLRSRLVIVGDNSQMKGDCTYFTLVFFSVSLEITPK